MRQEVAYLEESSYNEVKRRQPGAHIFEALRITRQGIDLFTGSTFMLQQEKKEYVTAWQELFSQQLGYVAILIRF